MAANVSLLFLCPKCNQGISAKERPERCPGCNYRFRKPGEVLATKFEWGKSIPDQFFELVQQEADKMLEEPLEEIIGVKKLPGILEDIPITKEMKLNAIKAKWEKKRDALMLSTTAEDIAGHVLGIHYLMTLAIPSGNRELTGKLAVWGKKIGELAKVLQDYIDNGGRFNEYRSTEPGNSGGNNTNIA